MKDEGDRRERYRQYRLLLVIAAVIVVTWMIWEARAALFPFAIGLIIAYLLAPLVAFIQYRLPDRGWIGRIRRTFAVVFVYLVAIGIAAIAVLTVGSRVVNETLELIDALPGYIDEVREESGYWNEWYEETLPADVRAEIEANLDQAGAIVVTAARTALLATVGTVQAVVGLVAGLALLPLWLFYVLKDQGKAFDFFYRIWPEGIREDVRNVVAIADGVLGAYIRGQIFLGVVVGVVTFVALYIANIPFAAALGVLSGVFELIPILGPWLSFIAAAIVVIATEPGKIWVVVGIFLAVQQIENTFLVPKIQGDAVNMNPALIMVLLVVGGALFGLIGVIVIVPLAAIARDIFVYVYNRLAENEHELDARSEVSQEVVPHAD